MIIVEVRDNTDYVLRQGIDGPQVEMSADEAMDFVRHVLQRRQASASASDHDINLLDVKDGPEWIRLYVGSDSGEPELRAVLRLGDTHVEIGPFTTIRDQVLTLLNK